MKLPKRRILMNAFFKAQFNYCPIIWMFQSSSLNNKINRLHERCLSIVYNDKHSNFEKLQNEDNSVSIHYNNIQALAIELYKIAKDMSPKIMSEVFKLLVIIYSILRSFLQIQVIVLITELNVHGIWEQRFGSKYLQKLKISNLFISLKEKSKNGNLLNVHVEFVGHLYLI